MKNTSLITSSLFSLILITSCAQKTRTANVAAASGGALGAAIGAMVGNQTGSTAGGFLIGGAAGAGTGLAIGRALEGQENEIANQREAIVRQNQILAAQQAELDELKRLSSDKISYKNNSYNNAGSNNGSSYNSNSYQNTRDDVISKRSYYDSNADSRVSDVRADLSGMTSEERLRRFKSRNSNNIVNNNVRPKLPAYKEQDIIAFEKNSGSRNTFREESARKLSPVEESKKVESEVLYDLESNQNKLNKNGKIVVSDISASTSDLNVARGDEARGALNTESNIIRNKPSQKSIKKEIVIQDKEVTEECVEAKKEYSSALSSIQIADKLYHYRRALRLCPDHAGYHTGLGKVYLSLNRFEDAKYEFEQALVIDPSFKPAKEQLASIE